MEHSAHVSPGDAPLLLTAREVEQALTLEIAFDSQVEAFRALATGEAVAPDKLTLAGAPGTAWSLCYAARTSPHSGVVTKLVSVAEHNPERGLPMINALVTVNDARTGQLVAIMDGTAITTIRTAAASAVAAMALAAGGADTLGVIGSGVQAVAHIHAIARIRPIRTVRIWSPKRERREQVANDLDATIAPRVLAVQSAEEAVRGAAIVAACSHSSTPVVRGDWLEPGSHVSSVGSYTRERMEVDEHVIARASLIAVDDPAYAMHYAGPIVDGVERGLITADNLVALGDLLLGRMPGRQSATDITFFNSVGIGVQDAAAAWAAVQRARTLGLGRPLAL